MMRIRTGLALTGALLLSLALAGCRDELTQVVLVVQSDLVIPTQVDGMDISAVEGPFEPPVNRFFSGSGFLPQFPLSIGFQSGGATHSFSVVVRLFVGVNQSTTAQLVMSRAAIDVRFVDEKTMMLVFPMRSSCACDGTTCPSVGNPECDNMDNPELLPFDPAVAPPSTDLGPAASIGLPTQPPRK